MGKPAKCVAAMCSQHCLLAWVFKPVSTNIHPVVSFNKYTLMWSSAMGMGMRAHKIPGATSTTEPSLAGASKG
jgi:hypothetical protein